jgi:DNA polymerase I
MYEHSHFKKNNTFYSSFFCYNGNMLTHSSHVKRVLVVDSMALLFRNYFAMMRTNMQAADGMPTTGLYGFLKTLYRIQTKFHITHTMLCLDTKEPNFRHVLFPDYKKDRPPPPEDLLVQIIALQNMAATLGFSSFKVIGYEADDLAASITHQCLQDRTVEHVFLLTSDKDYGQILQPKVSLISLKSKEADIVYTHTNWIESYGIHPHQVIDWLGIMGDSADGFPGIPGIGEKTACALLQKYQTFAGIYDNWSELTPKQKTLFTDYKDLAILCIQLATLKTDAPVHWEWQDTCVTNQTTPQALNQLQAWNMNSLLRLVDRKPETPTTKLTEPIEQTESTLQQETPPISPNDWFANYRLVTTQAELDTVLKSIAHNPSWLALDTETTGLDIFYSEPIGFSVCQTAGTAFYVPCIVEQHSVWHGLWLALQKRLAQYTKDNPHWEAYSTWCHNAKFDTNMLVNIWEADPNIQTTLKAQGDTMQSWLANTWWPYIQCSLTAHWNLASHLPSFSLDALTLEFLHHTKIPTSQLIGKQTGFASMFASMDQVPLPDVAKYACEDADAVFRLVGVIQQRATQDPQAWVWYKCWEQPMTGLLWHMERRGCFINHHLLNSLAIEYQQIVCNIVEKIHGILETEYELDSLEIATMNLNSPKQIGELFFGRLGLGAVGGGKLKKTSTGQFKTDQKILESYKHIELVRLYLEYKEYTKLLNTYLETLPQLVHEQTGRVHTQFLQHGTSTGRLASVKPNLQNIPIKTNIGKRIRQAFQTNKTDHVILCVDYSQIELRVLAYVSQDPDLIDTFRAGKDIHRATASRILNIPEEQVTAEQRSKAKAVNFGLLYGMGPQRLAKEQGMTEAAAKEFIAQYFASFPTIKQTIAKQQEQFQTQGFVTTVFGRRRYKDETGLAYNANNIATNTVIQGTAAEIMKQGMLQLDRNLQTQQLHAVMVLQVHDELVLEVPTPELEATIQCVRHSLEHIQFPSSIDTVDTIPVNLQVEIFVGNSWQKHLLQSHRI